MKTLLPILLIVSTPTFAAETEIKLQPHKAIYDLTLADQKPHEGIDNASGKMFFEFTGNACDGYITTQQSIVTTQQQDQSLTNNMKLTHFESGDGKKFQFSLQQKMNDELVEELVGKVEKESDGYKFTYSKPTNSIYKVKENFLFPNAQTLQSLKLAQKGEKVYDVPFFDGTLNEGHLYKSLTIMGNKIDSIATVEEPLKSGIFKTMPRNNMTFSIVENEKNQKDSAIPFSINFEMYQNGVSRALVINNASYSLNAKLSEIELLPETACK